MKGKRFKTLEEDLLLLQQEAKTQPITIREILHQLHGKGRLLILILLAIPFCLLIPIPGLPFGIVVAFVGLRMIMGKPLWLPEKLLRKKIEPHTLKKITDKTLWIVRKLKRFIHPRLNWACHSPFMEILNGVLIIILGILLALPVPVPFSNFAIGWSIFFIALGILEDDGVFVLVGYLFSLITIVLFTELALLIKHSI